MEHTLEPVLEPKHKIFLSHSGQQKDFVEILCEALESRCRSPFFDKRPSSLPKGESFANLIFQAVEQCEMMVVVISDDYFMSKWPMMELQAFVQAIEAMKDMREKYILPLFYELSVEEFRDEERRRKWVKTWVVAKEGGKRRPIDVNAWEKAVDVLGTFNGIIYNKSSGVRNFLDDIVSCICDKIIADVKWDDSHVQGKSNICKVFLEKAKSVDRMEKFKCKTLGIFGVGGIGKTTICKALCNELSNKYEGRVCHIELETQGTASIEVESLRKLVILLTDKNSEFVQKLDGGQCKNILKNSDKSQRSFIALDNVWDNYKSITEAKTILETPKFHEESLVVVTARSKGILGMLGICGDSCFEMPELGEEDAVKLFLYHAAHGKQFGSEEEKCDILKCIQRCYFKKGGGNGWHYHPLALHSLGAQVSCVGERPSEWVRNLPRYGGGNNPVFDILRCSFDMLESNEQSLFMDLVVYKPFSRLHVSGCDFRGTCTSTSNLYYWSLNSDLWFSQPAHHFCWVNMVKWLCLVHKVSEDKIKSQFDSLKQKGLLLDVDWTSGRISVHDLYMEFAELESKGMLDKSIEFENRRCIKSSISDLKKRPSGGCWQKLSRVGILRTIDQIESLERIKWGYFSNVEVLDLNGVRVDVRGSLNLKDLECLRSLAVIDVQGLDRIEGLDGLDDLTFFKWEYHHGTPECFSGKSTQSIGGGLPASLEILELDGVWIECDSLAGCSKLQQLTLSKGGAVELDLNGCSSLQIVSLQKAEKLHSLSLPRNSRGVSRLKILHVVDCRDLVEIPRLNEHIGLEQLVVDMEEMEEEYYSPVRLQLPDLANLTKLKALCLSGFRVEVAGLSKSNQAPSLRGCDQLEILQLKLNDSCGDVEEQTNLEGLENLPALRYLKLYRCRVSAGWPDLSRSRKLEVIKFYEFREIMLHEDDMDMLASLPLLQRVTAFNRNIAGTFELDVRMRKWRFVNLFNRSFHIPLQSVISECFRFREGLQFDSPFTAGAIASTWRSLAATSYSTGYFDEY